MKNKIVKSYTSGEYHYVFGEVYAPGLVDTDGESMLPEDIEKMAHDFIAAGLVSQLDINHTHELSGAEVVESFIARKGDPDYTEGAWVLGVRMKEGPLWEAVKAGDINGFSVEALVRKQPVQAEIRAVKFAKGVTEPAADGHRHSFVVDFDDEGRVKFGRTEAVNGHTHDIIGTVTTEKADGHAHRFFVE